MSDKIKLFLMFLGFIIVLLLASLFYNKFQDSFTGQTELHVAEETHSETDSDETSNDETEEVLYAPDFTVYDRNGDEVKLSDYLDKPVVVNFWASWCGPCKDELPHFDKFSKEYEEQINILMVSLTDGSRETQDTAEKYIDKYEYDFDLYFDLDQDAAYTYGVSSIPATVFVNTDGIIDYAQLGSFSEDMLREQIESLISAEESKDN